MIDVTMGRAGRLSFIASFYVYVLPIFGPHGGWLVGELLFQKGNDSVWRLSTWVLVLGVQLLSYAWFRLCFRFKAQLNIVALMAISVPFAWFMLFFGLMQVIPAWRLVEPDVGPEKGGLAEVCKVDGKWITLSGQFDRALLTGPREDLLVQDSSGQRYFLLHVPGCTLSELPLPKNSPERALAPVELAQGGRVVYTEAIHGQSNQNYGLLIDGKIVDLPLFKNLDPTKVTQPRLSPDGGAVAWIVRAPGQQGIVKTAAVSASGLRDGSSFELAKLGPGSYDIIDITAGAREILLARNLREYLLVTSEGVTVWQLKPEEGVRPILGTIRMGGGAAGEKLRDYMAWEGYREQGRYVIQWRRGDKLVQKEIPLGRSISSADASRDGRYIAASTSPAVSIGSIDDAVVIWSADGSEVFRKRLKPYNRAPIVFLAGNLVAYSEVGQQGVAVTRVLKLW